MNSNNKNQRLHRNVEYIIGKYYNIKELLCMCKDYNDGVLDVGHYTLPEEVNYEAWLMNCNNDCYFKSYCEEINNNNKNILLN